MNIEEGLDLSSKTPTALVQRLVPSVFKEPKNILYTLDAREMRDPEHKTEAGRAAGMRLAAQIDSDLISMVTQRATNVITMADSTTGSQGRDLWNCAAGIDATMTAIGVPQGIKTNRILTATAHNIVPSLSLTASSASEHGETSSSALVHRRLNISP